VAGWLLVAAGAVGLLLGWIGVSREVLVAKQLPYLVSGGFAGLGLIILGARLLVSEDMRSYEGRLERMEHLVDDLHELLVIANSPSEPAPPEWRVPPVSAPRSNGTRVVVLETGTSFHRPDCRLVRNKAGAKTLTPPDALQRGKKPCGVCEPSTPAVAAPMGR
jgi:hypothetical protein